MTGAAWRLCIVLVLAGASQATMPSAASAQPAEAAQATALRNEFVAMLHSVDANGQFDGSLCGSAIFLSQSDGRTLLLTAKHVLDQLAEENDSRRLSGEPPIGLGAQFFGAVGTFHEIRPLPGILNASLDYAVIEVLPRPGITIPPPRSWNRIGVVYDLASLDDKVRFQDVRAVGYSRCRSWATSISPEKVTAIAGTDIIFETRFVDSGSSGGALFAADGRLVGMVIKTEGDEGIARSLDVILSDLGQKNVKIDLTYGDAEETPVAIGAAGAPTYASQITGKVIQAQIEKISGTGVRMRPQIDGFAHLSSIRLVGDAENRDVRYGAGLAIVDVLTKPYQALLEFSDGSSATLPIDFRTPMTERIKALGTSDEQWLGYHSSGPGAVVINSPAFEIVGMVKSIDVGWSPTRMPHHAVLRYSGFSMPKLPGAAGLNAVEQTQEIVRPADADRAWFQLTFADGTVTPPRAFVIPPAQLDPKRWNYAGAHLLTSADGVVFSYRYRQDDVVGARTGGSFSLSRPYGLKGSYRLEYDLDGRGFIDSPQYRIPWTSAPFKVRFLDAVTGGITGPFALPAPDIAAIRDDAPPAFPEIVCERPVKGSGTCRFKDFRVIGHVRTWRMSFVSEAQLRSAPLADLKPVWSTVDGRYSIRACRDDNQASCQQWRREMGALWDIPAGATDFFFAATMRDGRTVGPQRIVLPN